MGYFDVVLFGPFPSLSRQLTQSQWLPPSLALGLSSLVHARLYSLAGGGPGVDPNQTTAKMHGSLPLFVPCLRSSYPFRIFWGAA